VPQELANTAWSCAHLLYIHGPLFASISSSSRLRIGQFNLQSLASTAWAFSDLGFGHSPLLAAIAEEALTIMDALEAGSECGVLGLVYALATEGHWNDSLHHAAATALLKRAALLDKPLGLPEMVAPAEPKGRTTEINVEPSGSCGM